MITEMEARAWIEAYGVAWTTQDPEKIVRLFTKDATYRERRFHPGVSPAIEGLRDPADYWDLIVYELQRDVGFAGRAVRGERPTTPTSTGGRTSPRVARSTA